MHIQNILAVYKQRTLTRDLSLMLSVTMIVVLALLGTLYYKISVTQAERNIADRATETANNLADVLSLPLWELDNASIEQIADAYLQSESAVGLQVIDDQNDVLYQQTPVDNNIITERRPVIFQDRQLGYVEISFSTQSVDTLRQNILLSMLGILLSVVLTVVVVTRILLERFLKTPLENLTQGIDTIAGGDYEHRMLPVNLLDIQAINEQVNFMASQIQERDRNLEKQVAARTHDLQVAAEVSRQITTELDINKLLHQIVQLTTERFQLYACFVFQFDDEKKVLTHLAGINSEGQKIDIADQISIDDKASILALVARTQKAVTVNDVTQSETYLAHEKLPETCSELAIPMLLGNKLLGVFDLQSRVPNRFTAEDLRILTSLAEQVTIAIRNAQLFSDVEQARQDAEEANRIKSQFLANMSHELRTPLNAILNFTAFVKDGDLGEVNNDQTDALNQAYGSGKHLLALINDVLDLTKIEAGLMDFFIQEVDLNEVLNVTIAVAKGLTKDKPKVMLKTDIAAELAITYGDKRRIRQVLLNLVSNAVKFTLEGSITINATMKDDKVNIQIIDTGIGIAPEDQDLIFESFKQAKHILSESIGTGLGLPITKFFVESHGGKISVESEIDKGTTFNVELPILTESEAQQINEKIRPKAT